MGVQEGMFVGLWEGSREFLRTMLDWFALQWIRTRV